MCIKELTVDEVLVTKFKVNMQRTVRPPLDFSIFLLKGKVDYIKEAD